MLLLGAGLGIAGQFFLGNHVADAKCGVEFVRDGFIATAILLTTVIVWDYLRKEKEKVEKKGGIFRPLAVATTVGACGLAIGSWVGLAATGWTADLDDERWSLVVDWVSVVTNGWIGDSSTQIPIMLALEEDGIRRRPNLVTKGGGKMAAAFLWDWIVTLLWFFLAVSVAGRRRAVSAPATTSDPVRWSNGAVLLVAVVGMGVAAIMYTIAHNPCIRGSILRPFLVIGLYVSIAILGYALVAPRSFIPNDKPRRKLALNLGIGALGVATGLGLKVQGVLNEITPLIVLLAVSVVALGGHVLALALLRWVWRFPKGLLAVASMCCVGAMATAPEVARAYQEANDLEGVVEVAYACCLVANVLSIPLTIAVWASFS
jgi:hypothetical protein